MFTDAHQRLLSRLPLIAICGHCFTAAVFVGCSPPNESAALRKQLPGTWDSAAASSTLQFSSSNFVAIPALGQGTYALSNSVIEIHLVQDRTDKSPTGTTPALRLLFVRGVLVLLAKDSDQPAYLKGFQQVIFKKRRAKDAVSLNGVLEVVLPFTGDAQVTPSYSLKTTTGKAYRLVLLGDIKCVDETGKSLINPSIGAVVMTGGGFYSCRGLLDTVDGVPVLAVYDMQRLHKP